MLQNYYNGEHRVYMYQDAFDYTVVHTYKLKVVNKYRNMDKAGAMFKYMEYVNNAKQTNQGTQLTLGGMS